MRECSVNFSKRRVSSKFFSLMSKGEESSEKCLDILRGSSVLLCFEILSFGSDTSSFFTKCCHQCQRGRLLAYGLGRLLMASSVVIDGN